MQGQVSTYHFDSLLAYSHTIMVDFPIEQSIMRLVPFPRRQIFYSRGETDTMTDGVLRSKPAQLSPDLIVIVTDNNQKIDVGELVGLIAGS